MKGSNGSAIEYPKITQETHVNCAMRMLLGIDSYRFFSLKLGYIFTQLLHPFWALETLSNFNCYMAPTRTIKDKPNCFINFLSSQHQIMNTTKPENLFTHLNKCPQKGLKNTVKGKFDGFASAVVKKNPFWGRKRLGKQIKNRKTSLKDWIYTQHLFDDVSPIE